MGGSLFPYLHDQLSTKYELYYVDSDATLTSLYRDYNFFVAPLVTDEGYSEFIKSVISKYNIDFYIPLIDEELVKAKKELDGFGNVKVITPSVDFCELSLHKFKLMKVLADLGISRIASSMGDSFVWTNEKQIFVKPVSGRGSRGIKRIDNQEQLQAYYLLEKYNPEEILIQEYITGTEFTIGATVNNFNELLAVSIKRVIRKKGITQIAITEDNKRLLSVVEDVVAELKPCGPVNIQLYLTESDDVKIFEINPRFSTTTIMSYAGGVDEISLYIDNYNKHYFDPPAHPKYGVILHRRWESIFYE